MVAVNQADREIDAILYPSQTHIEQTQARRAGNITVAYRARPGDLRQAIPQYNRDRDAALIALEELARRGFGNIILLRSELWCSDSEARYVVEVMTNGRHKRVWVGDGDTLSEATCAVIRAAADEIQLRE